MSFYKFLLALLNTFSNLILSLNTMTLDNGTTTVGFFTICIGFTILNILIKNYRS